VIYLQILQRHGLLAAVVVLLGGLLAATNVDMLRNFESVKAGPIELKIRALTLGGGRSPRGVVTARTAGELHEERTLWLWQTNPSDPDTSIILEKARAAARIAKLPTAELDSFDDFRRAVITPVADLDAALAGFGVDMFDSSPMARYLAFKVREAVDHRSDDVRRRQAILRAASIVRDLSRSVVAGLGDAALPRPVRVSCSHAFTTVSAVAAAAENASGCIDRYLGRPGGKDFDRDLLRVANSPYLFLVAESLIQRAFGSARTADQNATIAIMDLMRGGDGTLNADAFMRSRDFDIVGRVLVVSAVSRAVSEMLPSEQYYELLLAHYVDVERFAMRYLGSPSNRALPYRPCQAVEFMEEQQVQGAGSKADVCEGIEYRSITVALNNLLFAIADDWVKGEKIEVGYLNVSERLLPRAEARIDMLRGRPREVGIYVALIDTTALARLMLAVEASGKPDQNLCRRVRGAFEEAIQALRSNPTDESADTYNLADLADTQTLSLMERRLEMTERYCTVDPADTT
jgi:hypothetical protein